MHNNKKPIFAKRIIKSQGCDEKYIGLQQLQGA